MKTREPKTNPTIVCAAPLEPVDVVAARLVSAGSSVAAVIERDGVVLGWLRLEELIDLPGHRAVFTCMGMATVAVLREALGAEFCGLARGRRGAPRTVGMLAPFSGIAGSGSCHHFLRREDRSE